MAKKVWISFPLSTASEANDAAVVSFLKGGQKKELEVELAAFVTKWMFDKSVPFGIDFDSAAVDRNLVMAALPKRLQKALGVTIPVVPEAGEVAPAVLPQSEEPVQIEDAGVVEPAGVPEAAVVEQAAEVAEVGAETAGVDEGTGEPSELR